MSSAAVVIGTQGLTDVTVWDYIVCRYDGGCRNKVNAWAGPGYNKNISPVKQKHWTRLYANNQREESQEGIPFDVGKER